ncbi:hypothetical protein PMAYCL1PPCAC_13019, partial [Pristionchus mayeri]
MLVPTVLLLLGAGFTVQAQQFEPFNENSINLDGLFGEEFDSINNAPPPPPPPIDETTVASPSTTTVSPIESIDAVDGEAKNPSQSGLIFDEVVFPPEEKIEETREEIGEGRVRPEEEKRGGISIYRPLEPKSNEKKKKSGSTGWTHTRKRLVKKGTNIVRAQWNVIPDNISTIRPHFQRKRRILTRVSHVKPVRPPTLRTSSKTRGIFRPAPVSRLAKTQWINVRDGRTRSKKTKGISRSRSRGTEERGRKMLNGLSDRRVLSRVARTDERRERGEKKLREQIKKSKKSELDQIDQISEQIQVKSARQRFEYALDRNALQDAVPAPSSPFRPLSTSSFSHYSPPPLLLPPLRTTQLSSIPRHRLNAHDAPVLLHRLHEGDWQRLRLLQREEKRMNEESRRRTR